LKKSNSARVTPAPCLLECAGRNTSVPMKLPGHVSLIAESKIEGVH
jgi:hypothetical protein